MVILSVSNLTKYYGVDLILEEISFSVNKGEKVGLIGANGAGKTTLFNILTKNLEFDSGEIYYGKDVSLGYLKQQELIDVKSSLYDYCLESFNHLIKMEAEMRSVEEKIATFTDLESNDAKTTMNYYSQLTHDFDQQNGYGYHSEIRGILRGLGFTDDEFKREVSLLSGGQKSRLNIAKLLMNKPDLLLLDEPTNHLDIKALTWLEGFLKDYSGTLIIISHDRYFLDATINRTIEIENRKALDFKGNYSSFMTYKDELYEHQLRAYENQSKEIEKQEALIRKYKGHGTEKLAKRARSREKRLDQIEVLDKPIKYNESAKLNLRTRIDSGNDVLHVEDLKMAFDNKVIFDHVNFDIYKGDRIGFIGDNGVGKTTLFKIILNLLNPISGLFKIGHKVYPGYYDQEQSNLNFDNNMVEEISDANPKLSETDIRNLLGSFLFKNDDVFKTIKDLSGGEKGRLSLLKLMLSESNFLLLDEPTNHLDIRSKETLEDALLNYDGTLFAISHDRYFLNKICTKIIHLKSDGTTLFLGNYDYYVEKSKATELETSEGPVVAKTRTQLKEEKKKEKAAQKAKKEAKLRLETLEVEIHETEERIHEIELKLCDEAIYSDLEKMQVLNEELLALKEKLDEMYELWDNML